MKKNTGKEKIDIYFIAKKAEVSPATVSRVFNRRELVKENKVERVLAICKEYDYKPSHIARAIRTRKTKNIALIVNGISVYTKNIELIASVESRLDKYGYCLNIFNTHTNKKKQKYIVDIIDERVIDGVILQGSGFSEKCMDTEIIELLNKRRVPSFFIERYMVNAEIPYAVIDGKKGGNIAAEYLLKKNHRNIGIVSHLLTYKILKDRVSGFLNVLKKAGIKIKFILEFDIKGRNPEIMKSLIKEKIDMIKDSNVSAIFCTTDIIAISLINALSSGNIKVPGDISVIGYDNHPLIEAMPAKPTTIDNDLKKLGEIAVDNLVARIEKGRLLKKKTVIEPSIIEGETVRQI